MAVESGEVNIGLNLQIGAVAKKASVSVRTVRFYEERGLLSPAGCTSGGIRLYTARDVNRLIFIRRLKMVGLSIGEIKICLGAVGADSTQNARIERTIELLTMQREKVEEQISMLMGVKTEIEASLEKVEKCLHCTMEGCPEQCTNRQHVL
jgi:MerR family Zn(II)-responsive transcriptional regulator of zntA